MNKEQFSQTLTQNDTDTVIGLLYVKRYKKKGDIGECAEILGLTANNVQNALERIDGKHHKDVVETLVEIIEARYQRKSK